MSRDPETPRSIRRIGRRELRPLGGLLGVVAIAGGGVLISLLAPAVSGACPEGAICASGDLGLLLGAALVGGGGLLIWNALVS